MALTDQGRDPLHSEQSVLIFSTSAEQNKDSALWLHFQGFFQNLRNGA